ncbi:TPA: hypothetical protein ACYRWO_001924, partial [Enterobacter hormaechei]|uniref:hypothetical protein n=1 Tax=Enterobacter hormaechei TaxID=158836 RepID=UPI001A905C7D
HQTSRKAIRKDGLFALSLQPNQFPHSIFLLSPLIPYGRIKAFYPTETEVVECIMLARSSVKSIKCYVQVWGIAGSKVAY